MGEEAAGAEARLRALFESLDVGGDGTIDLREFTRGIHALSPKANGQGPP